jgi:hypothetical protein
MCDASNPMHLCSTQLVDFINRKRFVYVSTKYTFIFAHINKCTEQKISNSLAVMHFNEAYEMLLSLEGDEKAVLQRILKNINCIDRLRIVSIVLYQQC